MSCPPSYEEQQMMRYYAQKGDLKQKLSALKPEGDTTFQLLMDLKTVYINLEEHQELLLAFDECIDFLGKALAFDLKEVLKEPEFSNGWPTAEDVTKAQGYEEQINRLFQELEYRLCETGQLIYQVMVLFEQLSVPISPDFHQRLVSEKNRYQQHREEDRTAEIERLEALIENHRNWVKKFPEHPANQKKIDEIPLLKEKIERIKSYAIKEILNDRLLFFRK